MRQAVDDATKTKPAPSGEARPLRRRVLYGLAGILCLAAAVFGVWDHFDRIRTGPTNPYALWEAYDGTPDKAEPDDAHDERGSWRSVWDSIKPVKSEKDRVFAYTVFYLAAALHLFLLAAGKPGLGAILKDGKPKPKRQTEAPKSFPKAE